MLVSKFKAFYEDRGYDIATTQEAIESVEELEQYFQAHGSSLEDASIDDIKQYIAMLIDHKQNTLSRIVAVARYYYLINNHRIYLYFTKLLGGLGVIDSIRSRAEKYAGEEVTQEVFDNLKQKPFGTAPEDMPDYTVSLMERLLTHMEPATYQRVLAGNNHGIPREAMLHEKRLYEEAESMEDYLKGRHQRKIQELQEHCDQDKVWFEQEITQDVVDYVAGNQEILSAVLDGETLYVTKIPYDTRAYLKATDPKMKSYYACHCPFAREAIQQGKEIPSDWCYCSGGFAKYPFEVILDRELDVTLLESALKGDDRCRFAIHLGDKE